ncbi:MAG: TadE family protein [Actinomycetota bacterium]|nr:TadE family protein [Actinomycetota bacterium]
MSGINKNKKNLISKAGKTDAQASLEFVLVIPFLILIILAVSHLGLMLYQRNVLEQAAREGSRVVVTTNSNDEALECIREVCPGFNQDRIDVRITPEESSLRKTGDMVEVVITYDAAGIPLLMNVFKVREKSIKAKSQMRMECY